MNLLCKIFLFIALFATTNVFAQLPDNIGFENGNFSGWETSVGRRSQAGGDVMEPPTTQVYSDRFIMLDATYKDVLDPYGDFPMLCPNGSKHSIKLGNDVASGKMQRITYTFNIPAGSSSYSLVFNYAVVLENPGHGIDEQPLFSARIYNETDKQYVSCPAFDFAASSGLPGFKLSSTTKPRPPRPNGTPDVPPEIYYKDWSTAMINLKAYSGKTLRLEFTSQDCRPSGHFGYAYLDIDEQLSLKPISGNVFCSTQAVTTLTGPTGFENYTWYKDNDFTKPGKTGQSITVPAIDREKYALHITPYLALGCEDTLYTVLQKLPDPFNLKVVPKIYGCPGTAINLTAANVTSGSSPMKLFSYYKDEFGLVYLPNPDKVTQSGVYYIRGTNAGGCTDIQPVEVMLVNPEITITDPIPVRYPEKVDLSFTFIHLPGFTYSYFADAAATIPIDRMVGVTGIYYIKAISNIGCSIIKPIKAIIDPPLPYTIEAPNTFTPNADGINDNFSIKISGYVSLTQLTIFNRYGQQVFTTRSINDYWTGNNGSNPQPVGTYYWIFDGTDDYYHTKVKKSSSITIIR